MTQLAAIQGDITKLDVDVIVNAANSRLVPGGGVDGAIHAAGGSSIARETTIIMAEQGFLATGESVITGSGVLPSRYVIHTVGPIWGETPPDQAVELLGECYESCLGLAANQKCRSIAFPSISTGVYGFPKLLAAETSLAAVREWVDGNPNRLSSITFVCFEEEDLEIYRGLLA